MSRRFSLGLLAPAMLLTTAVFGSTASSAVAVTLEWTRQLGTSTQDFAYGVSADGLGNVYISGSTSGNLGGPNAGSEGEDAFVAKYDSAGSLQWTRQLGTAAPDISWAVSADRLGNVYLAGQTAGSLGGPSAGGLSDAFVSKYTAAGSLQWTKQFGTAGEEELNAVAADVLGNVYVCGETSGSLGGPSAGNRDVFVTKYDSAGNLQWTKQFGTSAADFGSGVSADGLGNVYVSGTLGSSSVSGDDAFVAKYDAAGVLQWMKQLGTSAGVFGGGVAADGLGNVYISGGTDGDLSGPSAGNRDAFVRKYDAAGNLQWTKQLGTSAADGSSSASADGLGNVYISGSTGGDLGGTSAGGYDAFITKYDAAGNLQWIRQQGSSAEDVSRGISADGQGNVYVGGYTSGSLGGPNAGSVDAFVAKYFDTVPEPSAPLLTVLALVPIFCQRRQSH